MEYDRSRMDWLEYRSSNQGKRDESYLSCKWYTFDLHDGRGFRAIFAEVVGGVDLLLGLLEHEWIAREVVDNHNKLLKIKEIVL